MPTTPLPTTNARVDGCLGSAWRSRARAWLSRLVAVAIFVVPLGAGAQVVYSRAAVEGALLGQIVRFIEWPSEALDESRTPLHIVVLGAGELSTTLRSLYAERGMGGHRVRVTTADRLSDVRNPHIIMVTERRAVELEAVIDRFGASPVLIVTEQECGCALGASLHFFVDGGNVRFEISRSALRRAGLSPSYHLLRYASTESGCR